VVLLVILFGHKTSPTYWSVIAAAEVQVTFMWVGFEFDRLQTKDKKVVMYCGTLCGTDTHEVGLHFQRFLGIRLH
jgi:hypothetical protein